MARDRIVDEFIYEETMAQTEQTCVELELHANDEVARTLAEALRRAVQSLRLAMVADADASILARIKGRLDSLAEQAPSVLAACDTKPASQRPTAPPPSSLDPIALFDGAPCSDRPTLRPSSTDTAPLRVPAQSGVVSKVFAARPGKRNAG
jgi:hypothetical protein